ncbi:MAG: hypothetical protein WCS52_19105 [bacterium]
MPNFIPNLDVGSCRFLNLRTLLLANPCPHCMRTETLKAHGFLKAADGTHRGIRAYCSNRRELDGCGRTFSIHFVDRVPGATLGAARIGAILDTGYGEEADLGTASPPATKPDAAAAAGQCSRSTAYRWLERFRANHWLAAPAILRVVEPDRNMSAPPVERVWRHLRRALGEAKRVLGRLHVLLQVSDFLAPKRHVRPNCHRSPGRGIGWLLAATGFGKDLVSPGGAAIIDISHWLAECG